jgi:hypothetical protein
MPGKGQIIFKMEDVDDDDTSGERSISKSLKQQLGRYIGLAVAVCYGAVSIAITIFNKAVLSEYNFNFPNTLALGQMIFSLGFLVLMKHFKLLEYHDFSWKVAAKLKWLTLSFGGMVTTGLASLAYVNIPMYSVLRRLTTCITLIGEQVYLKRVVPADEQQSVYLMVFGAVIAGWGDLEFHLLGYVLIFINCVFTAWYLLAIKKAKDETGLNTFGFMFYNNLFSLPLFAVIVLVTEAQSVIHFPYWTDPGFLFCFLMSSIQAFFLNYFIFLCSIVNSPLTTSITGQLKNILTTIFGFFLFGGIKWTVSTAIGLTLSSVAGVWYGYIKHMQMVHSAPPPPSKPVSV